MDVSFNLDPPPSSPAGVAGTAGWGIDGIDHRDCRIVPRRFPRYEIGTIKGVRSRRPGCEGGGSLARPARVSRTGRVRLSRRSDLFLLQPWVCPRRSASPESSAACDMALSGRTLCFGAARFGVIDRSGREATSPLGAVLYVFHHRLVNGYSQGSSYGGSPRRDPLHLTPRFVTSPEPPPRTKSSGLGLLRSPCESSWEDRTP
jgi:hypothetical protein